MAADSGAGTPAEQEPIEIGGTTVAPGSREDIEIHVERLASGPWISIPAIVVHGRRPGPKLSVSAAVHGDEINGVEVIRRLVADVRPEELAGTMIGRARRQPARLHERPAIPA